MGFLPALVPSLAGTGRRRIDPARCAWSLPVHPTQLYSAIDGVLLLLLLSAYYPLRRRDGEVMALLMVTYPITRFLIEYLRNDEGIFWFGLTISQNISVFLLLPGSCSGPGSGGRSHRERRSPDVIPARSRSRASGAGQRGLDVDPSGDLNPFEDTADDVVGGQAFGLGLGADDDPVAEDVAGQALDVVRRDVVAAREQRMAPRDPDQGDRGARARPELQHGAESRP